jgi:DNA polymerase-3 subunit alpha
MSSPNFVHLHLHTQYSLLDGANKISEVIERAHALGQPAIGMTDHGNMHGAIEFFQTAKKVGIKPIIGCELYVTPGSRFERKTRAGGGEGTHHLTVLAKSTRGYHNLCKLSTRAYREGFYFKPRVDHELLAEFSSDLIILSGCLASEIGNFAKDGNIEGARRLVEFYKKTYNDNFYFEIQPHPIPEQRQLNQLCIELAQSMGIPMVATTDCHYIDKDDHFAQEVLMCVSTGKQITDPTRIRHEGISLHLKTAAEMIEEFDGGSYVEEALRNSLHIAEQCSVDFNFKIHYMPQFKSEDTRPLIDIMSQYARHGLAKRLELLAEIRGPLDPALFKTYHDRLEDEIRLIERMGFAGYFLVVSDFIVWAKEHGIPVGPGRGSVGGSLVAYAMRITEVDAVEHKCLFERFLNPERISLPDIDVDFCINGRDRVIKYVVEKYGASNVAQIATFGTLKAKAAIKDVGRALGISYAEADRVAQLVPAPRQGFDYPLAEAIKMEKRLADYAANEGKQLIDLAMKLEGLTRHSSTHAAGVVIADRPLEDLLPMMVDKDDNYVTQFSMEFVEKIGLLKFDFLGLKTLSMIHTALRLIRESRGVEIDMNALPLNDKAVFTLLSAGNTTGVFQLESTGITEMTLRLKPSCFEDLVAILALYRPGPLDAGMVDHYINRKHKREEVVLLHPSMKEILQDTHGIMVYQEQIMQLAQKLAGYSLGEADLLRKAMGKKDPEEMAKQRERFLSGAEKFGIIKKLAGEIFDQMETFARYGFNRSHTVAYALISYQTAYLKAHYNVEFMAALLSHEIDDSDKILKNLAECRKQGVAVLGPDVNHSIAGFSVRGDKIRYGLEAVKGVGEKAVEAVILERTESGDFQDLNDFVSRVNLSAINRRVIDNFVKCGAFDFSGTSRREMLESIDSILKLAQSMQGEKNSNQISLFGSTPTRSVFKVAKSVGAYPEWPINQKLAFEREALGFYISGHPLEKFRGDLKRIGASAIADLKLAKGQKEGRAGGVVTLLKLKNTKKGDRYANFVLEDNSGTIETLVWPDLYKQVQQMLLSEDPIVITGKIDGVEERRTFIAQKIESLISLRDKNARQGLLALKTDDHFEERLDSLLSLLKRHMGPCPVKVKLHVEGGEVALALKHHDSNPVSVVPSEILCDEVEQLFGRPVLSFI